MGDALLTARASEDRLASGHAPLDRARRPGPARDGEARVLDRTTGRVVRRYERARPGELIHVDGTKLGRIPDGGGHRVTDRMTSNPEPESYDQATSER